MTDARINYIFDFEKEVEQIYSDFAHLQSNMILVYLSDERNMVFAGSEEIKMHPTVLAYLDILQTKFKDAGSCASEIDNHVCAVFFDPKDADVFESGLRAKASSFILSHELGHILMPSPGSTLSERIYRESNADAFAAIRHLQRFDNDTQMLETLCAYRSDQLIQDNDQQHLTTPVIRQIIEDSKYFDFKSLSCAETVKAALGYAEKYMPSISSMMEGNKADVFTPADIPPPAVRQPVISQGFSL